MKRLKIWQERKAEPEELNEADPEAASISDIASGITQNDVSAKDLIAPSKQSLSPEEKERWPLWNLASHIVSYIASASMSALRELQVLMQFKIVGR